MKFTIAALLLFSFAKSNVLHATSSVGSDLLVNGDFKKNPLHDKRGWIIANRLYGWETSEIEIGNGSYYNPKWGNSIVVELDANNKNSIIKQRLPLKAGKYILQLKYAARINNIHTSSFSIYWNEKFVTKIDGKDTQIHDLQISLSGQDGWNVVQIHGEGQNDSFGMTIADVRLLQSQRNPDQKLIPQKDSQKMNQLTNGNFLSEGKGQQKDQLAKFGSNNFLVNGDFKKNPLHDKKDWIIANRLYGWETSEIEIGNGSYYNPKWGNSIVVELDANNKNSIIKQRLPLKAGKYILQLKYAARINNIHTSSFSIYWNEKFVTKIDGKDTQIHDLQIPLSGQDGWNVVQIHGEGQNDSFGMTIADVRLLQSQRNPDQKLIPQKDSQKMNQLTNGNFLSEGKGQQKDQLAKFGSNNLLVNGDFKKNHLPDKKDWIIANRLYGWETSEIEIGNGSYYNPKWGNSIVVELDANNKNSIIKQRLPLKAGKYILQLKYAARINNIHTSSFSIYWNEKFVTKIDGKDTQIHDLQIPLSGQDGWNVVQIHGEGQNDSFGMTIADVRLLQSQRNPDQKLIPQKDSQKMNQLTNGNFLSEGKGQQKDQLAKFGSNNLLVNGDFKKNHLPDKKDWIIANRLYGWETSEIEIGNGSYYNPKWGNSIVVELDANNKNSIIKQRLPLKAGKYILQLKYAARINNIHTSSFSIYWNEKFVTKIDGKDTQIHDLQIPLSGQDGWNVVQIHGEGQNDSFGMTIADVRLLQSQRNPDQKLIPQKDSQKMNQLTNGNFLSEGKGQQKDQLAKLNGWIITKLKHGIGNFWNPRWSEKPVIQLPLDGISQQIYLQQGSYRFELKYAAAQPFLASPKFSVWLNQLKILEQASLNKQIHTSGFNFLVNKKGWFNFQIKNEGSNILQSGLTLGYASVKKIDKQALC